MTLRNTIQFQTDLNYHGLLQRSKGRKRQKQFLLTALLILFNTLPATAQEADKKPVVVDACVNLHEMVLKLKTPAPVAKLPWQKIVGVQGMERLLAAVQAEKDKNYLLLAGEARGFDLRTRTAGKRSLYLTQINGKGEEGKDIRTELPDGYFRHLVTAGNHLVAVDARAKDGKTAFVLLRLNKQGIKQSEVPLSLPDGEIADVTAILPDGADGSVYLALAQQAKRGKTLQSVVVRLNADGKQDWKRSYMPGTDNQILSFSKMPDGSLLVLGQVEIDDGRKAGWFVNLTANGALLSQMPLPRGADASLLLGKAVSDGAQPEDTDTEVPQSAVLNRRLLAGTVKAADENDGNALWVLQTAVDGGVVWQRYLTSPMHDLVPLALHALPDGRQVVLANAVPKPDFAKARPHIRQLVFSNNGYLMGDNLFQIGSYSQAVAYLPALNSTDSGLIIGNTRSGFIADDAPDTLKEAALDGLVIATPAFPAYTDACRK